MTNRMQILSFCIVLALGIIYSPQATDFQKHSETEIDCTLCHTGSKPNADNPQLKPCPRHTGKIVPLERMGPQIVILDELQEIEDLYVPVRFNHQTHAHMSSTEDGCSMCHHYSENNLTPSSCAGCHPRDVIHENLAQPGLKGAYHRQCVGCHVKWDTNTDCIICHEKKAGGKLNGQATTFSEKRLYPAVNMRELIVYETSYETGDKVPFHHKRHADQYDRNCGNCHHSQGCETCHDQKKNILQPMGSISPEEMHDRCFVCHGNDDCTYCHGRAEQEIFTHQKTGWPLAVYHEKLHCMDCHTQRGEFSRLNNECIICHAQGWNPDAFDHAVVGVPLDEVHQDASCVDCHAKSLKSDGDKVIPHQSIVEVDCTSCHDDKRVYDKQKGFTSM